MRTKKEILKHLQEHVEYPATKRDLITSCSGMMDVPKSDKTWFEKKLPSRTYTSANEVMKVLDL